MRQPMLPFADRTLADIASGLPGATAVFRGHRLDFCCGGQATLADAAERRGVPVAEIAAQLAALQPAAGAEVPATPGELIRHIVQRYHETHRRELPELIRLAARVEAVHRGHPGVPAGLTEALKALWRELDLHMQKEERVLFPMIAAGAPGVSQPVAVMRGEHDGHGERLREVEQLARGCEVPDGACPTWRALYAGVRKLVDDVMEHIHLENNRLFPRIAA